MAKKRELHYIFDDPNTPEDWEKFLIKMCTKKLYQEVMKGGNFQCLKEKRNN